MSTFSSRKNSGSPPRMRGKVLCGRSSAGRHGITPAYAGKSTKQAKQQDKARDHPRVCGEKPLQSSVNCTMEGLPPRMRGKVISSLQCDFLSGITPACAGKSFWPCTVLPRCRDHPRVCGEKNKFQTHGGPVEGSPPRVRGKALVRPCWKLSTGITPAYAGKRDLVISESGDIEDHPRVCGEKRRVRSWRALLLGSPPRMRGKDGVNDSAQAVTGITPACAGKSSAARRARQPSRDHPRVCGEKTEYRALVTAHQGSPPRMRGKEHVRLRQ